MNQKRPIYRMCAVTREKLVRSDLYRVVKTPNGVVFDSKQNIKGRGVYIKKDLKTIELAHSKKVLNRALKCEVNDEVYLALIQELSKERRDR
jgi:predicted RNA-binding protein YlxR (DUF448 family)